MNSISLETIAGTRGTCSLIQTGIEKSIFTYKAFMCNYVYEASDACLEGKEINKSNQCDLHYYSV